MRRILLAGGAALVLVTTIAACTHNSSGSRSSGGITNYGPAADPAAGASTSTGGDSASSAAGVAGGGRAAPAPASPAKAAPATAEFDSGALIRTADLTVTVARAGDVGAKADAADSIALRAGGVIDADERTSGRFADATITLRVPPATLPSVLRSLSRLGHEVSRAESTQDVTQRVADVRSRVASAQQAIARLRTLYARAQKVSDVIAIEGELSEREADLESLQAQSLALSRQTTLAAVHLDLQAAKAAPPHSSRHGFLGGLSRGWDGFTTAAVGVATGIGAALPFLAVALILAFALRLGWRRFGWRRFGWRRFGHRAAPTPAPSPAPSE